MAAELGISPEILDTEASHPDKRQEKLRTSNELLEQLRSRCGQHRSWSDSIKAVKSNLMSDKRHYDTVERLNIQTCLDKLHRAMKINSQQSLIERLELICRQLGMVFTPPTPPENNILLSAEMFKVVIALDGQNGIRDVRVGHQDSPSTCEDLVEVLRKGDFDEFVTHIQGLLSIYNISGDKKLKTKGYLALSSLESDLNLLAQLQSSINGVAKYIHKSPLGILLPRRGGHPMKLIYFVSPYNLLCKKTRMSYAMTVEAIAENDVGHSVTVAIEPCATLNKLQTMPLMSVKQNTEGKSLPSFQAVNSMNSFSLPASFVLVLPQPVPIAKSIISAIQEITGLDVGAGKEQSLLSLLLQQFTEGQVSSAKELFVTLPDQQHAYFLNNPGNGCLGQGAALVTRIPFTQPTCVPNILNLLRQQIMFNSVMQSLIRPSAKKDYKSSLIFEVTALTLQYISVMFEHPLQDSMVTAEFDLSDITSVKCSICMNNKDDNLCSDEFVSRAFQRCFSIPVTLRTVIHKVDEQIMKLVPPEPVSRLVIRTRLKWKQRTSVKTSSSAVLNTNSVQPNMLTALPNPIAYTSVGESLAQGSHTDMRKFNLPPALNRTFLEPPPMLEEEKSGGGHNLLASLLETGPPHAEASHVQNIASESPMLSKLLEENTSVTTNLPPPNSKKRLTKRKSSKDMIAGKSPKIRLSESDMMDKTSGSMLDRMTGQPFGQGIAEKHIDLDSSGGSYDEPVRPASVSSVGSVGGHSSTGSIIDLTDPVIGESHVKKLENSLDSIMQKESRAGTLNMNTSVNVNSQMAGDMMDMRDFHHGLNPNQMLDSIGDFAHPQQWGPRQTPPHPLARNSPHHGLQKNEKISTSHEELPLGPGGREMEGPNTLHGRKNSAQRRQNLKRQNSLGRNSLDSSTGVVSPDVFSPILTSPGHHPLSSPSQLPISSPIQVISPGGYAMTSQGSLVSSSPGLMPGYIVKSEILSMSDSKGSSTGSQSHFTANLARGNVMNSMHHGSSGKPSLSALKAQLEMKNDVNLSGGTLTQEKDIKAEDHFGSNTQSFPPMKLKLNMKLYDTVSPPGSDENKSRSSTFDFHSDDEDFTLPVVDKITIVSSSPTRLQISNKPTLASFNNFNKTEKFKRKEREKQMKRVSSLDSGKRKREKEESKKERKKKRLTNSEYSIDKDMGVYQSTTVDVEGGSDNYKPITKLKITKSGGKMSIENSGVLKVTEIKPDKSEKPRIEKVDKEAVLKIEKVDKINRKEEKEVLSDFKDVKPEVKNSSDLVEKDKTIDKALLARSLAPSNEGIFDKINAMKSESISKGENVTSKEKTGSVESAKKSTSSKSQKTHKTSSKVTSSSKISSDSSSKVTKTPTIKLKPISVPSNSSSTSSTLQNSPSTPSTPKSVTQSPTSTTIGKIGAVSLATSGSHKSLTPTGNNNNNSKVSQQTGSNKIVNSTTKSLSTSQSTTSSTKSSSSAVSQKNLSGSSGKNSPVLQQSKSVQHSRSLSNPNSSTSKSEKGLSKSISSTTIRTSSPLSDKERNKSSSGSSRNSGSNNRDREKSTSSKNTVPVTTVITQETAASVLSFLNPKANKISSLPPIPKLSSASSGTQKVSTPTSAVSVTVSSSSASVSNSSNVPSSKYGKGNNSSTSSKTTNSFVGNKSTNSPNMPGNKGANVQNAFNNKAGSGNYSNSSNNRAQNPALTGSIKKTGSNSPTNFSQKNSASQYNKVVNSNNTQNTNFGHRNNHSSNSANAMRTTGQANSSNQVQNKTNKPSSSISGHKGGNSSFSHRGSGSSPLSRGSFSANSTSNSVSRPNTTVNTSSSVTSVNSVKGSVMGPNAPRGPGPPSQAQQVTSVSVNNMSDSQKAKTSSSSSHSSTTRNRKGSLSAVIDKLTCKASMPVSSDSSVSVISQTSKCIIEESPASPEPEPANTASDSGEAKEERKVVIFEAPASPEPEQTSTVVKKTGSSDSIVSIPLEERRESAEKQSNVNGDHSTMDKSVFAKPSNSLSNSPKVIPLNSHIEKSSLSHTTSVSTTKSPMNRHNSVSNSAIYSQQNGDIGEGESEIIKCDLSANSKSILGPDKAKDSPFKVPTPKSMEDSSKNQEDFDDKLKKKTVRTSSFSKSISNSPSSPVSSPENGLVIDFSSSPKNAVNRTNSPQCPNTESENRAAAVKAVRSSLGLTSNLKTSPGSPLDEDNLSAEGDSPFLDDDLMDAALGL